MILFDPSQAELISVTKANIVGALGSCLQGINLYNLILVDAPSSEARKTVNPTCGPCAACEITNRFLGLFLSTSSIFNCTIKLLRLQFYSTIYKFIFFIILFVNFFTINSNCKTWCYFSKTLSRDISETLSSFSI
jgi:hypothetical protein